MRYCDLTVSYTATSGGVRTYIDAKRQYLGREDSGDEHVLLIPGERDRTEVNGRFATCTVASPTIPGFAPYRFFWRPERLVARLEQMEPDVVELGSIILTPQAAFRYRRKRLKAGKKCLVGAYFHTDVANAYFGSTLRKAVNDSLEPRSHVLAGCGTALARVLEGGAERYFGRIFRQCDVVFASSAAQCRRLRDYGVENAEVVPLGIDLQLFHPSRRSAELRASLFDADDRTMVIVYAGRLDVEKHVEVMTEAIGQCRLPHARLVLAGAGPLRAKLEERAATDERLRVLPYRTERSALAALLASADIYATAGPHETFALSVVEAQASGLPVVGVDAGALPERVPPGTGFLGPVDDALAFARNLELAAAQRESLSQGARRHVEQSGCGWDATFERLFRIYRDRWNMLPGRKA